MNQFLRTIILPWCCILSLLCSCDDPLTSGEAKRTKVVVELTYPTLPENAMVVDRFITFLNKASGKSYEYSINSEIELIPGLYDVNFAAKVFTPGRTTPTSIRAVDQSVNISGNSVRLQLQAFNNIESDDLIISEIFFAGTLQPSGNPYQGDDYIKLYNNTDHTIYADGLTIFESKFLTTRKYDYRPDLLDEAMTVHALYTIPGNGTETAVEPGEYLLIADTGIDHRINNPNSFDLSHADFEWYDISTKPNNLDIDGPVANLDKWYCYTQSFWMLHNRGFRAFGIARIPIDRETYLREYLYTYEYEEVTIAGTFPMSQTAYKLPNGWIKDVVNCSIASEYAWQVSAPDLDCGWTSCGSIDQDKNRFFHSVRRKLLYIDNSGRAVYSDTNNSTEDFNSMCTPSEIELQHTSSDINGTICRTITYDGVTPIKE